MCAESKFFYRREKEHTENCLSTSLPLRCDYIFSWWCLQDRQRLLKTWILRDIRRNETCKTVCLSNPAFPMILARGSPEKIVNFLENQKKCHNLTFKTCAYFDTLRLLDLVIIDTPMRSVTQSQNIFLYVSNELDQILQQVSNVA